jgi:type II secretory pathway predicted ATPase ExeA
MPAFLIRCPNLDSGGTLSVVLAGHPKLKNDLRRPSMEEIGSRATIFELEGLGNEKRKYIKWLLMQSVAPKTKIEGIITEDALATLSEKLSTPLQFEFYLTRALEASRFFVISKDCHLRWGSL